MSFEVTILGSSAAIPTAQRFTTSQYVQCHQRHILIDCGEGTQIQLRKYKIKFQQIQIILISHLHGDHVFGLPGLLSTMGLLGRTTPLKIYGPKGIKDLVSTQLQLVGLKELFPIEFIELDTKVSSLIYEDKCIEIKNIPLKHRVPTNGYLICEKPHKRRLLKDEFDQTGVSVSYISKLIQGDDIIDSSGVEVKSDAVTIAGKPSKSYAFCSDTAFYPEVIPLIKGVDLLYHEATFLDSEAERATETFHSTAKQAATIANESNATRLVLGHFSARYRDLNKHKEEAETIFEPCFIPEDGELFVV